MKPIIGVMPLWDTKKGSIWMLPDYLDGLRQAGGIPIIFPFTEDEQDLQQLMNMCDGFLFTGGQDVDPRVYNEEPLEGLIDCCEKRDQMEAVVLREAIIDDKPILGICRGMQFINAALGGKLYQDLPIEHPSEIKHRQQPPYDVPTHNVAIVEGSPLYQCLEAEQLAVNSCHHQAVKEVAPGLEVMAAASDGIVEAVYKPDSRFLWAVQWHPECSFRTDANSRKIFQAFVETMAVNY